MKFTLPSLKVGQKVQAVIVEVVADNEFIASFRGDLLRIANKTRRPMKQGESVVLEVASLDPFRFKLPEVRRFNRFDVSV